MAPQPIAVGLTASVTITAAAASALPRETGGVLIGWHSASGIRIVRAVELPDEFATPRLYTRSLAASQAAIRDFLAEEPDTSPLGYVGEWHSHTKACSASELDLRSLKRVATGCQSPITLLIALRTPMGWRLEGHTATGSGTSAALVEEAT